MMTSIVRIAITHRNLTAGCFLCFATSASKPMRGGLASGAGSDRREKPFLSGRRGSAPFEITARRHPELLAEGGNERARSRIAGRRRHLLDRGATRERLDRLEQNMLPPPPARAHPGLGEKA